MTGKKAKLMEQYAITLEQKTVYRFKDFKYDNFDDALVYAKIDSDRDMEMTSSSTSSSKPPAREDHAQRERSDEENLPRN
jgi:hypothetical protein